MSCERCLVSTYIVADPQNGGYVCTECGLVASGQYMEDYVCFDHSTGRASHEYISPFQLNAQKDSRISNSMFYSMQDPHQMKLVNFNTRFTAIADEIFSDFPDALLDHAKSLYLLIEDHTSMKGRNLDLIICSLIYISAKSHNRAMNLNMLGRGNEKDLLKCVRFLEEALNVKHCVSNSEYSDREIESYIMQYCETFHDMPRRTRCDIIKLIPKTEFIMRKKNSIAAALIIYHMKDNSLIKTLSTRFCLSDTTIRSVLRELK